MCRRIIFETCINCATLYPHCQLFEESLITNYKSFLNVHCCFFCICYEPSKPATSVQLKNDIRKNLERASRVLFLAEPVYKPFHVIEFHSLLLWSASSSLLFLLQFLIFMRTFATLGQTPSCILIRQQKIARWCNTSICFGKALSLSVLHTYTRDTRARVALSTGAYILNASFFCGYNCHLI